MTPSQYTVVVDGLEHRLLTIGEVQHELRAAGESGLRACVGCVRYVPSESVSSAVRCGDKQQGLRPTCESNAAAYGLVHPRQYVLFSPVIFALNKE